MPDTAIKDQIKKLVELQKTDEEAFRLKAELREKPEIIQQHQDEFEEKRADEKALQARIQELQVQQKELELELQGMDDDVAKGNTQLYKLKTNKEYSAKIAEIEGIKADKSVLEEKILKLLDQIEELKARAAEEKERLSSDEEAFLTEKKRIEEDMRALQAQIDEYETMRKDMVGDIDPKFLAKYDQILNKRDGIAIAPVVVSSCGGCHMNLTQQTLNRIRMYDELVQCDFCLTILYIEDDL